MAIKFLSKSDIKNKTVLLRGSIDVSVNEITGKVEDDFRIRSFLPTVKLLLSNGNKVIICGKRGRPKGKIVPELSLKPVAEKLAQVLNYKFIETDFKIPEYHVPHLIFYTGDFIEEKHRKQLAKIHPKDVIFLENLEFSQKELQDDPMYAKNLSALAEAYVNDDFSKCHHLVASLGGVTKYLPSFAGLLLEQEIKSLDAVLKQAKQPMAVMTGGMKLTEKVGALENLGKIADKILVGGGVATLMFKTKGFEVGISKIEEGESKMAWQIMQNFKNKLILPLDVVVADEKLDKGSIRVCLPHEVGTKEMILDVGPKTIMEFSKVIKTAKTIVWSGPLGMFEHPPFHHATFALSRLIGGRGKGKAFVVAGGGDTVDAIRQTHQAEHIDHVSTGGGAMLEYLAGKKLPGIEALKT